MNSGSIHSADKIRHFFASIAAKYDIANHILSGGSDILWRRTAVTKLAGVPRRKILDLATGSGDLARMLIKRYPESQVVGADFCLPMLDEAKRKNVPDLVAADALHLPFEAQTFDVVTIAFGLRNMTSWSGVLDELSRVLNPTGTLLILDFSRPRGIFGKLYHQYLHRLLPQFARLVTGNSGAYEYLGDSIERFPEGEAMEELLRTSNFHDVRQTRLTGGIASIYLGTRSDT